MTGKPHPPGEREQKIGARIAELRREAGLTQVELAAKIGDGWTETIVMNIERARVSMRVGQLLDVAAGLDVAPSVILDVAAPKPKRRVRHVRR